MWHIVQKPKTLFWSPNARVDRKPAEPSGPAAPHGIKQLGYDPFVI